MTDREMPDRIQFRPGKLAERIVERADERDPMNLSADLTARRDLTRYYQVLANSLPRLEEGEAMWLVDVLNSTVLDERTYRYLAHEIADSIQDGMEDKWGVNGHAFVDKLLSLSPGALMALVDAVERFWLRQEGRDAREVLVEVRLLKEE